MIRIKRVYEKADITDGERILVERSWPRGIRRSTTNIDYWIKEIGPSIELKRWFMHNPTKWAAFKSKYRKELLDGKALYKLADYIKDKDPVTLLYVPSNAERNNAKILISILNRK